MHIITISVLCIQGVSLIRVQKATTVFWAQNNMNEPNSPLFKNAPLSRCHPSKFLKKILIFEKTKECFQ